MPELLPMSFEAGGRNVGPFLGVVAGPSQLLSAGGGPHAGIEIEGKGASSSGPREPLSPKPIVQSDPLAYDFGAETLEESVV